MHQIDTVGALNDLNKAIAIDSKNVAAYMNKGVLFGAQGKYYEALKNFKIAVRIDQSNFLVFFNLGKCYNEIAESEKELSVHKVNKALQNLDKSIKLEPKFYWTYVELARSYILLKDYKKALNICQKIKVVQYYLEQSIVSMVH